MEQVLFTAREFAVATRRVAGMNASEIAKTLGVRTQSVYNYIYHIRRKLDRPLDWQEIAAMIESGEIVERVPVEEFKPQLQYRKCGKNCKVCQHGKGHGPYWYRYYRDQHGKLCSLYVGKEFVKKEEDRSEQPAQSAST